MVHRDVKPHNVLLSDSGEPQLADFGSARVAGRPDTPVRGVTGSVPYCAPEVLDGATASARSDVYSLAATLYFLLAGEPPFTVEPGEPLVSLYLRVAQDPPPAAPASPDALVRLLRRSLAKDPAERHADAAEMRAALLKCSDAGRWSTADADRWWTEHGPELSRPAATPPAGAAPGPAAVSLPDAAASGGVPRA